MVDGKVFEYKVDICKELLTNRGHYRFRLVYCIILLLFVFTVKFFFIIYFIIFQPRNIFIQFF